MYLEFEDRFLSFSSLELNGASYFISFSLKFTGVLASSSLEILVFLTEWLPTFAPVLWMPALSAAALRNFQIWFFPSGAFMYHISLFSRWLPCLMAKKNGECGCLYFLGSMIPEKLVKFYGTPYSALRLEHLLVTILGLCPMFIYPDKHFVAILDRILLQFHVPPTQLGAFISGCKAEMEG